MSGPKPMASLTSGLLARKGDARPAIRPAYIPKTSVAILPVSVQNDSAASQLNDDKAAHGRGEVAQFPVPATHAVRQQQERIAQSMADPTPAPAAKAEPKKASVSATPRLAKARTAFTLRLDPERHLRLRLAKAVSQRSAQEIVTEALDAYLDSQPGLSSLTSQALRNQTHG